MSTQNNEDTMREYKDKDALAKERVWKTALVVVQDENGEVFVENSKKHFADTIQREATSEDAVYMLSVALEEFKLDRLIRIMGDLMGKIESEESKKIILAVMRATGHKIA